MMWRGFPIMFLFAVAAAPNARACVPAPPEPMLAGESSEAYRQRVEALEAERRARWLRERQAEGLERATMIFIAREVPWSPPTTRHSSGRGASNRPGAGLGRERGWQSGA